MSGSASKGKKVAAAGVSMQGAGKETAAVRRKTPGLLAFVCNGKKPYASCFLVPFYVGAARASSNGDVFVASRFGLAACRRASKMASEAVTSSRSVTTRRNVDFLGVHACFSRAQEHPLGVRWRAPVVEPCDERPQDRARGRLPTWSQKAKQRSSGQQMKHFSLGHGRGPIRADERHPSTSPNTSNST